MLLKTYNYIDVNIKRAFGTYLVDDNNNIYLDTFSGLGVNVLGHQEPELLRTFYEKAKKIWHISNFFCLESVYKYANLLCEKTGKSAIFFANSGTEANECAIKIIFRYWNGNKRGLIAIQKAFHGRTIGALSLTGKANIRDKFFPPLKVYHIYPDELERVVDNNTAAVFFEPILGEGGIIPMEEEFFKTLKKLKQKYGFIVVADEIQCGFYRTGNFLASYKYKDLIDIVTLGKGIGGGFPLSACIVNERLKNVFLVGDHGSTFGGNPLFCELGIKMLEIIEREKLPERIKSKGYNIKRKLERLKNKYSDIVKDIRGRGYMIGVELKNSETASKLKEFFFKNKILINITSSNVWRLLPSYTFPDHEWERVIEKFEFFLKTQSDSITSKSE